MGAQRFALLRGLARQTTAPMNPTSISETTVKVYDLAGATPVHVPATIELLADRHHIVVTPKGGRLAEQTTYALVLSPAVRDATGKAPVTMPIGHFLQSHAPILVDGKSQINAVDDHQATKLEDSRAKLAGALDKLGRDRVFAAWPFTTMSVAAPLEALRKTADTLAVPANPANVVPMTPGEALRWRTHPGSRTLGDAMAVNCTLFSATDTDLAAPARTPAMSDRTSKTAAVSQPHVIELGTDWTPLHQALGEPPGNDPLGFLAAGGAPYAALSSTTSSGRLFTPAETVKVLAAVAKVTEEHLMKHIATKRIVALGVAELIRLLARVRIFLAEAVASDHAMIVHQMAE